MCLEHLNLSLQPGILFLECLVLVAVSDELFLVVRDLLPEFSLLGVHGCLHFLLPGECLVQISDESVGLVPQPEYRLFFFLDCHLQLRHQLSIVI